MLWELVQCMLMPPCTMYIFLTKYGSLKGPTYEAGTRMQAASGLHHLMSNHWHVMVSMP